MSNISFLQFKFVKTLNLIVYLIFEAQSGKKNYPEFHHVLRLHHVAVKITPRNLWTFFSLLLAVKPLSYFVSLMSRPSPRAQNSPITPLTAWFCFRDVKSFFFLYDRSVKQIPHLMCITHTHTSLRQEHDRNHEGGIMSLTATSRPGPPPGANG